MTRQLELLPEQFRAGIEAAPENEKASPAMSQAIGKIVGDSVAAQRIHDQVMARLKSNYDEKRLQAILNDFSSPLVKRMVSMETKPGTPQEQMAFMQELSSKPLSQARIAAILELDRSTHAGDLATEITIASIKAMAGALVGGNKDELAQLDQALEQQRSMMETNIHSAILSNMAFTYREASDGDLTAYAKVYGAEHNQWLSNIVMTALSEGIKNASRQIGKRLAANMKNAMPSPTVDGSGRQAAPQAMPETAQSMAETPGQPVAAAMLPKTVEPSKSVGPAQADKAPVRKRDVRDCLSLEGNPAIAKCVEEHQ